MTPKAMLVVHDGETIMTLASEHGCAKKIIRHGQSVTMSRRGELPRPCMDDVTKPAARKDAKVTTLLKGAFDLS